MTDVETIKELVNAGLDGMATYAQEHDTSSSDVINALMNMAARAVHLATKTGTPEQRKVNSKSMQDTLQRMMLDTIDDTERMM
jgi:regulator of RNase E activity RraB